MRFYLFSALLLSFFAFGQPLCFGLAGGSGLQFEELIPAEAYNSNSIVTVSGPVQEVLKIQKVTGMGEAVIVKFSFPEGDVFAVLAPDWFLENKKFAVTEGEYLTVKGSKIDFKDKSVIIAAEVSRQDKKLELRDMKSGHPKWSEWRRGEEIFYKNYKW